LPPQQEAELIFKLDVSKDAVPEKNYQLKVLFEFSDSYRDDLNDEENAYLRIKPQSSSLPWAAILLFVVLAAVVIIVVKRRSKS
jgi:hypothetical protein